MSAKKTREALGRMVPDLNKQQDEANEQVESKANDHSPDELQGNVESSPQGQEETTNNKTSEYHSESPETSSEEKKGEDAMESTSASISERKVESSSDELKRVAGKQLRKHTHEPISVRIHQAVIDRFDSFCKDHDLKKGDLVEYALTKLMDEFENSG